MSTAEVRFRQALELHDDGRSMFRLRLRREHPDWSQRQVEAAVLDWLLATPLEPGRSPSPERVARMTSGPGSQVS